MSLSDGLAEQAASEHRPSVVWDGSSGRLETGAVGPEFDPHDFTAALKHLGEDPDNVQITLVGSSRWTTAVAVLDGEGKRTGEYRYVWNSSYRYTAVRDALAVNLPALYAEVARTRPKPLKAKTGDATIVVAWADIQTGKALADDTPMLTTDGWKTHGEVRPGDYVYAPDGLPRRVLGVTGSTEQELHRIEFDRGVSILATGDHLWKGYRKYRVGDRRTSRSASQVGRHIGGGHYETRELLWNTAQIAALPQRQNVNGTLHTPRSFQIDLTEPLDHPEVELPIDPYLLGIWLGDGNSHCAHVTKGRQDHDWLVQFGRIVPSNCSDKKVGIHIPGLRSGLRQLNLLRNKHIPKIYLTASPKQRLALLQGLMDTDGSCERGMAEFSNTNFNIADGVCFLLASLGFKYTRIERIGKLNGKECKPFVRLAIPTRADMSLFTLKRKSDKQTSDFQISTRRRQIQRVTPAGWGMAQCLKVEGGMYLAGRELIVTHNCDHLGGLHELLARLDEKRAALDAYLKRASFDRIVVADVGDIIEGFSNFEAQHRTNTLSLMDQIDVAATEFWKTLRLCERHAPVDVLSIPSNHCAWRRSGKNLAGKTTDDWGLHISKRLERQNEDAGLRLSFHRAEEWCETLQFDVRGHNLGLVHGHQVNNPDQTKTWWAKMTHAGVLDCHVLLSGHFHFASLRPCGKDTSGKSRWHIQAPTLDNGSSWVRNKYGEDGDPALAVFRMDADGFDVQSFALL